MIVTTIDRAAYNQHVTASDDQIKRLRDLCDQAERLKEAAHKLCSDITNQLRASREADESVEVPPRPAQRRRRSK